MTMTKVMGVGVGDPGYGPLCAELERAYRLLAEMSRDPARADGTAADDGQMAALRERIKRCEGRLLVVSLGQEAPCDIKRDCS